MLDFVGPFSARQPAMDALDVEKRLCEVTLEALVDKGLASFGWVHPKETPGGERLHRKQDHPLGGFVYMRKQEPPILFVLTPSERGSASGGKRTDHLIYEAYEDMAEKKMREIGDEVRSRWGIEDFSILHRIGRLEVGEISVLIAVSSPHRSEAFAACQYAIDRLKQIVPIWKKEVGEDGESWVEGPKAAHSSN